MDLLREFFDPIPLPAMGLAIFALLLFWAILKFFRFPDNFRDKEAVREEVRFRLFANTMEQEMEEEKKKEMEGGEKDGEKDAADAPKSAETKPAA